MEVIRYSSQAPQTTENPMKIPAFRRNCQLKKQREKKLHGEVMWAVNGDPAMCWSANLMMMLYSPATVGR